MLPENGYRPIWAYVYVTLRWILLQHKQNLRQSFAMCSLTNICLSSYIDNVFTLPVTIDTTNDKRLQIDNY